MIMDVEKVCWEIKRLRRLILTEIVEPIHRTRDENESGWLIQNRQIVEREYIFLFSVLECLGKEDELLRNAFNAIEWKAFSLYTFGSGYGAIVGVGDTAETFWTIVWEHIETFGRDSASHLDIPTYDTAWHYYIKRAILDNGLDTGIYLPSWSNYLPTTLTFVGPPRTPEHAYFRDFAS